MRIGIVAEGRGDLGVLTRILKGALEVDEDAVQFLRPEFDVDETDSYAMAAGRRSNWSLVLDECRERQRMREFLGAQTDEPRVLVVHVDAAECGLPGFDVERPAPPSATKLCERIERMILGLLEDEFASSLCLAIAVEESEAWVLPLYVSDGDTCLIADPKKRLERELNRSNLFSDRDRRRLFARPEYELMREVAKGLAKRRVLEEAANRNASLRRFVDGLGRCAMAAKAPPR